MRFVSVLAQNFLELSDAVLCCRGYQRAMVKSMTLAARIPHFHYVDEIDCKALVELKELFQEENSDPGIKHTFLPILIKSLSMALSKYPFVNSCFHEESQEVTLKGTRLIKISFATLLPVAYFCPFYCQRIPQYRCCNGHSTGFGSAKHKECPASFCLGG